MSVFFLLTSYTTLCWMIFATDVHVVWLFMFYSIVGSKNEYLCLRFLLICLFCITILIISTAVLLLFAVAHYVSGSMSLWNKSLGYEWWKSSLQILRRSTGDMLNIISVCPQVCCLSDINQCDMNSKKISASAALIDFQVADCSEGLLLCFLCRACQC